MTDFGTSPDPFALSIGTRIVPGDSLQGAFQDGDDLAILGIEFATKRRFRVNGRAVMREMLVLHLLVVPSSSGSE